MRMMWSFGEEGFGCLDGCLDGGNVRLTESVGPEMLVRVDQPNFRIEPRKRSATRREKDPLSTEAALTRIILSVETAQSAGQISEAYLDRVAKSRIAGEGGNHCGDVDELD